MVKFFLNIKDNTFLREAGTIGFFVTDGIHYLEFCENLFRSKKDVLNQTSTGLYKEIVHKLRILLITLERWDRESPYLAEFVDYRLVLHPKPEKYWIVDKIPDGK